MPVLHLMGKYSNFSLGMQSIWVFSHGIGVALGMAMWPFWSRLKHLNNYSIAISFCTQIHDPQKMNLHNFGDRLTFLAPSVLVHPTSTPQSCQDLYFSYSKHLTRQQQEVNFRNQRRKPQLLHVCLLSRLLTALPFLFAPKQPFSVCQSSF